MTKRTRLFVIVATGILVAGLGTGLVASYVGGLQNIVLGSPGPDELAYVPQDAKMIAFANVRDVMDSELRAKLMQFHPDNGEPNPFMQETGIDLEKDVDHIVAAMSADSTGAKPLVLVRGRFDASRIEASVLAHGGAIEDYNGKRLLTHAEGQQLAVSFVEPDLVAAGPIAEVKRAIDTKASGGANVTSNDELMQIVRDLSDGNAWAVARFDALTGGGNVPAEIAKQLPPITWFSATSHINGGVRAVVRAETKDETSANDLREVLRGFMALARLQTSQRPEFQALINSLQLGGEGTTVSLGFEVGPEVLDAFAALNKLRPQGIPEAGRRRIPLPEGAPAAPAL